MQPASKLHIAEIPRDNTKRYQEIPFGGRCPNGIPLVSLGISGVGGAADIPRDTMRYQRITVGIPPPKGWGTAVPPSKGSSWYLSVSLGISVVLPDAYPI